MRTFGTGAQLRPPAGGRRSRARLLISALSLGVAGSLALLPSAAAQSTGDSDSGPLITVAPEQADGSADGASDAPRIAAVLSGPGGVGYWVIGVDGSIEPIGTTILPIIGEPPEIHTDVIGARLGAPGALGVWLQLADGSEVPVGDPGPTVLTGEERPVGWLSGVAIRQLLAGSVVDRGGPLVHFGTVRGGPDRSDHHDGTGRALAGFLRWRKRGTAASAGSCCWAR